jgi:hypothetical protein
VSRTNNKAHGAPYFFVINMSPYHRVLHDILYVMEKQRTFDRKRSFQKTRSFESQMEDRPESTQPEAEPALQESSQEHTEAEEVGSRGATAESDNVDAPVDVEPAVASTSGTEAPVDPEPEVKEEAGEEKDFVYFRPGLMPGVSGVYVRDESADPAESFMEPGSGFRLRRATDEESSARTDATVGRGGFRMPNMGPEEDLAEQGARPISEEERLAQLEAVRDLRRQTRRNLTERFGPRQRVGGTEGFAWVDKSTGEAYAVRGSGEEEKIEIGRLFNFGSGRDEQWMKWTGPADGWVQARPDEIVAQRNSLTAALRGEEAAREKTIDGAMPHWVDPDKFQYVSTGEEMPYYTHPDLPDRRFTVQEVDQIRADNRREVVNERVRSNTVATIRQTIAAARSAGRDLTDEQLNNTKINLYSVIRTLRLSNEERHSFQNRAEGLRSIDEIERFLDETLAELDGAAAGRDARHGVERPYTHEELENAKNNLRVQVNELALEEETKNAFHRSIDTISTPEHTRIILVAIRNAREAIANGRQVEAPQEIRPGAREEAEPGVQALSPEELERERTGLIAMLINIPDAAVAEAIERRIDAASTREDLDALRTELNNMWADRIIAARRAAEEAAREPTLDLNLFEQQWPTGESPFYTHPDRPGVRFTTEEVEQMRAAAAGGTVPPVGTAGAGAAGGAHRMPRAMPMAPAAQPRLERGYVPSFIRRQFSRETRPDFEVWYEPYTMDKIQADPKLRESFDMFITAQAQEELKQKYFASMGNPDAMQPQDWNMLSSLREEFHRRWLLAEEARLGITDAEMAQIIQETPAFAALRNNLSPARAGDVVRDNVAGIFMSTSPEDVDRMVYAHRANLDVRHSKHYRSLRDRTRRILDNPEILPEHISVINNRRLRRRVMSPGVFGFLAGKTKQRTEVTRRALDVNISTMKDVLGATVSNNPELRRLATQEAITQERMPAAGQEGQTYQEAIRNREAVRADLDVAALRNQVPQFKNTYEQTYGRPWASDPADTRKANFFDSVQGREARRTRGWFGSFVSGLLDTLMGRARRDPQLQTALEAA